MTKPPCCPGGLLEERREVQGLGRASPAGIAGWHARASSAARHWLRCRESTGSAPSEMLGRRVLSRSREMTAAVRAEDHPLKWPQCERNWRVADGVALYTDPSDWVMIPEKLPWS